MQISSIMTSGLTTIEPDATIKEAAEKMRDVRCGILPVMERGMPLGVITDRDITIRATSKGLDAAQTKVRDIMTDNELFCCHESDH
ncbi:MAG: CBS domain-containing protein, partial [Rickettsiales bacterium]